MTGWNEIYQSFITETRHRQLYLAAVRNLPDEAFCRDQLPWVAKLVQEYMHNETIAKLIDIGQISTRKALENAVEQGTQQEDEDV